MNQKATAARHDQKLRESFIRDNEQTILKIASKVSGKYITRSDDEWSVALIAFNKAIDTYSEEKGEYLSYAGVLIKRALIDHYRAEKKYAPELPASYEMFTGEGEIAQNTEIVRAVARDGTAEQDRTERERDLKDEILEVGLILKKYGFSFKDLKDCSPKAGKTKKECAKAITFLLDHEEPLNTVIEYMRLPIKEIMEATGVKNKLLDRYRRYIIMAVVILNGEYPLLADYLQYVRKEGDG
ncbi:MAG: hypothetical protein IKR47_08610 [Lachnospiraceae bacterium]|nr:hypothetical protein [Lachnospiraceae bacterium]